MILRYPGAKTKLLPLLRPYIDALVGGQDSFHDPFIGSGSVLLDTARRHPNLRLCANDADAGLIGFWKAVSAKSVEPLCDRILKTKPTVKLFEQVLKSKPTTESEMAFRFYFLNRTSFSGLWRGGPIGGYGQRTRWKVDREWRAVKSVADIREAHLLLRGRLKVSCQPGTHYVAQNLRAPLYVDPPYFGCGDALYPEKMTLAEHLELSRLLRKARSWVLTLDDNPVVRELYAWACLNVVPARYHIVARSRWAYSQELVITPS